MKKPPSLPGRAQATVVPNAVVSELRRRFAAFRKANRRGSRIPPSLRRAVVEAAAQGVPMKSLWLACGVTKSQVQKWGAIMPSGQTRQSAPNELEVEPARCFSVVDPGDVAGSGSPTASASTILELRIGEWAISIRPLATTQSEG